MRKISSPAELETLEINERFQFKTPQQARSIPKDKIRRPPSLDRNERARLIYGGTYKGKTPSGEHEVVGRKYGNGRHLYHFFFGKN
jgi:hypothetical protein